MHLSIKKNNNVIELVYNIVKLKFFYYSVGTIYEIKS